MAKVFLSGKLKSTNSDGKVVQVLDDDLQMLCEACGVNCMSCGKDSVSEIVLESASGILTASPDLRLVVW